MKRYLTQPIINDLEEKMVFLGGPRQVGKTYLSFQILGNKENHSGYLNWDYPGVEKKLREGELPADAPLIVFDEIHKHNNWRNLVKGYYDTFKSKKKFMITGSAKLDYYKHGGDSLQGRYYYYRLHPLSLNEINPQANNNDVKNLLKWGGFPEPFLKGNETFWKRWQRDRQVRVIQEDLLSLEKVSEIKKLNLLVKVLPTKIGSPLSLKSLMEDLGVAHKTVARWLDILENIYLCFRISPFGPPTIRAVKKEQKLYLWDWSTCLSNGPRFENFVASHLLKYCHFIEDTEGNDMELRFIRDTDKREIDFVVLKNNLPLFAIECKNREEDISPHLKYFAERTNIPQFYQVHLGKKDVEIQNYRTRILPFEKLSQIIKLI